MATIDDLIAGLGIGEEDPFLDEPPDPEEVADTFVPRPPPRPEHQLNLGDTIEDKVSDAVYRSSKPRFEIDPAKAGELATIGKVGAAGARLAVPFLGLGAPVPAVGFGVGSFIGEMTGQFIEIATGLRGADQIDFKRALTEAGIGLGLGAVGGRVLRIARALPGAQAAPRAVSTVALGAEAAVLAPGAEAVRREALGEPSLTAEEALPLALGGAALGGLAGAAITPRVARVVPGAPGPGFIGPPKPPTPTILFPDEEKIVALGRLLAKSRNVPPGTIEQISLPVMRDLVDQVTANPTLLANLENTDSFKRGERLFSQLMEVVRQDAPHLLNPVLEQHLTAIQASVEEALSRSGMLQQQLSRVRQAANQLASRSAIASKIDDPVLVSGIFLRLNDLSRALAVTQGATQVRNNIVNTGRLGLEGAAKTLEGFMRGELRVPALIKAAVHPRQTLREAQQIIGALPQPLQDRLLSHYIGGQPTATLADKWQERIVDIANWSNLQLGAKAERIFRMIGMRGTLEELLDREIRAGKLAGKVMDYVNNPQTIPFWMQRAMVERGLDLTFAGAPKGALTRGFLKIFQAVPILTVVVPYPRYVTQALEFVGQFNPAGWLRLLGHNRSGQLLASDPTAVAQVLSQAAVGTMMLSGGLALRFSNLAGPRWFQLNGETLEGTPIYYDLRTYNPLFTAPLFFAELVRRYSERGELGRMEPDDINEGLLGMRKIGELGIVGAELLTGRLNSDGVPERLWKGVGEWVGRFTVPLRTLKDVIGGVQDVLGFEPTEREIRDLREHPAVGSALANVPFATSRLPGFPQRARLLEPGAREQLATGKLFPAGIARQFTGLSATERTLVAETLLDLDINPFEIGPKARAAIPEGRVESRAIEAEMGPLVDRLLPQFILSPFFQRADSEQRRILITNRLEQIRNLARVRAQAGLRREQPTVLPSIEAEARATSLPALLRKRQARKRLPFLQDLEQQGE